MDGLGESAEVDRFILVLGADPTDQKNAHHHRDEGRLKAENFLIYFIIAKVNCFITIFAESFTELLNGDRKGEVVSVADC